MPPVVADGSQLQREGDLALIGRVPQPLGHPSVRASRSLFYDPRGKPMGVRCDG